MASFGYAIVNDDSFESVLMIFIGNFFLILEGLTCVWEHIKFFWELAISIKFEFFHFIEIKLESLKGENKDIWEIFNTNPLQSFNFFIAFLTKISIISLKDFTFYEFLQGLLKRLFVQYLQSH